VFRFEARRPNDVWLIAEHREHARDALTLTGVAIQIDQLRCSLEAVAGNEPPRVC
jgi:hypothetical protein